MDTTSQDWPLLTRYAQTGDADAFAQLVNTHINFVYTTARRHVGSHAEDVTQAVFLLLAQKAPSLHPHVPMIAWLYGVTRLCCLNLQRTERRRKQRERKAAAPEELAMHTDHPDAAAHLDAGLSSLSPRDREAVLLRFFQEKSIADTARDLGISEMAARKRAQRGIERLRLFFKHRGFAMGAAGLSTLIAAEAAKAAPPALAASVSAGITAHAAATTAGTLKATLLAKQSAAALSWLTWKPIAAALILTAVGGTVAARPWRYFTPAIAPASTPTADIQDEATAPGDLCLVVTDMLVDPAAADALQKISTPTNSEGAFYTLRQLKSADLHATLAELLPQQHLLNVRDDMYRAPLSPKTSSPRPMPLSESSMGYMGAAAFPDITRNTIIFSPIIRFPILSTVGKGYIQGTADAITAHLSIAFDNISATIRTRPLGTLPGGNAPRSAGTTPPNAGAAGRRGTPPPPEQLDPENNLVKQASMHWSGDLAPGQCLLMMGDFGDWKDEHFIHVQVAEVYHATPAERRMFHLWQPSRFSIQRSLPSTQLWITGGQPALRAQIDKAILLNSQAPLTAKPAPQWTKRLSDGNDITLLGLSIPSLWPMCRWDPDGNPTPYQLFDRLSQSNAAEPFFAAIRVSSAYQQRSQVIEVVPESSERITLNIGAGKWTQHDCNSDGTVSIDGKSYKVAARPVNAGATFTTSLSEPSPPSLQFQIAAITKDGKRVDGRVESSNGTGIQYLVQTASGPTPGALIVTRGFQFPQSDVDHFVLLSRPREKVIFDSFAQAPAFDDSVAITPETLRAAETRLNELLIARCIQERVAQYAELSALPRDPATPEGAMRLLLDKAAAGDVQGIRQCFTGTEEHIAAASAAFIARYQALNLAIKKFGVEALQKAYPYNDYDLGDQGAIIPLPDAFILRPWYIQGDRASIVAFVSQVQRDGKWQFDLDRFFKDRLETPDFTQPTKDAQQLIEDLTANKPITPEQVIERLHIPTALLF